MNTVKKNGGFTLVELIIVIAILAILSSVAVAGYSSYIKKANDSAVNTELGNILSAVTLADAKNDAVTSIDVSVSGTTVTVKVTGPAANDTEFASDFGMVLTNAAATYVSDAWTVTYTTKANWSNTSDDYSTHMSWTEGGGWVAD